MDAQSCTHDRAQTLAKPHFYDDYGESDYGEHTSQTCTSMRRRNAERFALIYFGTCSPPLFITSNHGIGARECEKCIQPKN